jgi:hypothetical protein
MYFPNEVEQVKKEGVVKVYKEDAAVMCFQVSIQHILKEKFV